MLLGWQVKPMFRSQLLWLLNAKGAEEIPLLLSSCHCGHDLTPFSAPSPQQKCPRSTLMCFAEEAKVLVQEWEDIPINLTRKLKNIARLLKVIYG